MITQIGPENYSGKNVTFTVTYQKIRKKNLIALHADLSQRVSKTINLKIDIYLNHRKKSL